MGDIDPNALSGIIPSALFGQLILVNGVVFAIMARLHTIFPWDDKYDPIAAGGISALLNVFLASTGNHLYISSIVYGFLFGLMTTNSIHQDPKKMETKVTAAVMDNIEEAASEPKSTSHSKQV